MPVTTGSWTGALWPPDLQRYFLSRLLEAAPFARALTLLPTSAGSVVFPMVSPTGADWVPEMGIIPDIDMGDEVAVVDVAKLGGQVGLSNESIADTQFPLAQALSRAISDAVAPQLDTGLLYGAGPPAPRGIVATAPDAGAAPTFREAVIRAWSELMNAGAAEATVFASPLVIGEEWALTDANGQPLHADSPAGAELSLGPGIEVRKVPGLHREDVLALDRSGTWLVQRDDFRVDSSEAPLFNRDATVFRVRGRFAVACPDPPKRLRKVTIDAGATASAKLGGTGTRSHHASKPNGA